MDKPEYDLVPRSLERSVALVMMDSLKTGKYGRNDWQYTRKYRMLYNKIRRHLDDFMDGIDLDKDSGRPQLHHVATNVAIMLDTVDNGPKELDDR